MVNISSPSTFDKVTHAVHTFDGAVAVTGPLMGISRALFSYTTPEVNNTLFADVIGTSAAALSLIKDGMDRNKPMPLNFRAHKISKNLMSLGLNAAPLILQSGAVASGSYEISAAVLLATKVVLIAGIVAGLTGMFFKGLMIRELNQLSAEIKNEKGITASFNNEKREQIENWLIVLAEQGNVKAQEILSARKQMNQMGGNTFNTNHLMQLSDTFREVSKSYKSSLLTDLYFLTAAAVLTSSLFADTHVHVGDLNIDLAVLTAHSMFLPLGFMGTKATLTGIFSSKKSKAKDESQTVVKAKEVQKTLEQSQARNISRLPYGAPSHVV